MFKLTQTLDRNTGSLIIVIFNHNRVALILAFFFISFVILNFERKSATTHNLFRLK